MMNKILKYVILVGLFSAPIFVYGLTCNFDSDCPSGQVCRSNICIFEGGPGVTVTIGELVPVLPGVPVPGAPFIPPPPAEIVFKGKAYPSAILTILKMGKVAATFQAENSGLFEKKLTGLLEGTYNFGIWAEDSDGRKSATLNFTIQIFWGTLTTISNIFIPPTISLSATQVEKGETLNILGQVFPKSQIYLFISPGQITKETKADSKGKWLYQLDTELFEERAYQVKARGISEDGWQSEFSQTLIFFVGPPVPPVPPVPPFCRGADLNFDDKINLVDFSILLYWWQAEIIENPCIDVNFDKKVDIVDFSIMMYYWTG